MIKIVKRESHEEEYDEKKVYASVYASVINAHMTEKEAENIAKEVLGNVNRFIKTKAKFSSKEIKNEIIRSLKEIDQGVAILYEHHHEIC